MAKKITAKINEELAKIDLLLNIIKMLTEEHPHPDTIQAIMKAIEDSRAATGSIMQELMQLLSLGARL